MIPLRVPESELTGRLTRFRARMDADSPEWRLAAFLGRVNQYYLTGTMQDGALLVPRDGEAVFWVRRSFERAREESLFPDIRPMRSFRDAVAAGSTADRWPVIHMETEVIPLAWVQRFRKHVRCDEIASLDPMVARVRSVKSAYELAILERTGAIHRRMLEEVAPRLLRAGMSEAEFACELYSALVHNGHQGTVRFARFGAEIAVGQFGFGENSLYPTSFDGPGGCRGLEPAAPLLGSRDRQLRAGDLVFADVGFGIGGYSTDKTLTYMYGQSLSAEAIALQGRCVEIERHVASLLKPGAIPSAIYTQVMAGLDPEFLEHFMGYGNRRANFLGHGVGLQIDEIPVIAEGFDEPLTEGMVLAVEPKRGVPGVGMVGTENTYLVTPQGGRSLTGSHPGLMLVEANTG